MSADIIKVLIIDDQHMLIEPQQGIDIVFAYTVEQAKEKIGDGWDQVWWDFDLGGENTSLDILDWMRSETPHGWLTCERFPIEHCVIHSRNVIGSLRLLPDLEEMGYRVTRATELPGKRVEWIPDPSIPIINIRDQFCPNPDCRARLTEKPNHIAGCPLWEMTAT